MITSKIHLLPIEVRNTLLKIRSGFTFSHRKDGSTYKNMECLLPERSLDYYREYTVPTPDIKDRGCRRLVIGNKDEIYYTDDHYRTFQQVIE